MTINKSRMWKDGARRGIVYVEEREAAEKVMALRGATNPAPANRVFASRRRSTASLAGRPADVRVPVLPAGEADLTGHAAMAVYLDRKGRPFAWQIPFAMEDWERVTALVGAEAAAL